MAVNLNVKNKYAIKSNSYDASVLFQRDENTGDLDVNYTLSKLTSNSSSLDVSSGTFTIPDGEYGKNMYINYVSGNGNDDYSITIESSVNYTLGTSTTDTFKALENEPQLAFPSAIGAGAYTTGGRGGAVLRVNTLDWNDTQGSLKWALEQEYARTIVFDVSGIIHTTEAFYTISGSKYSNLTIAGQTAPEGGITIVSDGKFGILNTDEVIIRNVKFYSNATSQQSLDISGVQYFYLDHCNFRYAQNTANVVATDNTRKDGGGSGTIAFCEFGESFGTGMLIGGASAINRSYRAGDYTVAYNYYYNNDHRVPSNFTGNGRYESFNNVVYNPVLRKTTIIKADKVNHQNNYHKWGLRSDAFTENNNLLRMESDFVNDDNSIYTEGNVYTGLSITNQWETFNGWIYDAENNTSDYNVPIPESKFRASVEPKRLGRRFDLLTATQAYNKSLAESGCVLYLNADGSASEYRDSLTVNYINDIINKTQTYYDPSKNNWEYRSPNDVNYPDSNYPDLSNTRPSSYDTNNDGIPDVWTAENMPEGATYNDIAPSGYTWLEEFLNQVDEVQPTPPDPPIPVEDSYGIDFNLFLSI